MCRKASFSIMLQLVEIELLLELINSTACINKLLLAGEEGMAFGTNINLNVILNGLGNIFSATSTLDSGGLVIGMETLLHFKYPLFHILKEQTPQYLTFNSITRETLNCNTFFCLF